MTPKRVIIVGEERERMQLLVAHFTEDQCMMYDEHNIILRSLYFVILHFIY